MIEFRPCPVDEQPAAALAQATRGRGVARALLVELERLAGELGYDVVRLDTGPRQPRARRMYERAGYRPIENFNANPLAMFFAEKALSRS